MMISKPMSAIVLALFTVGCSHGELPHWAEQMSQRQEGDIFSSVCEGEGPTADLARMEAVRNCKGAAAEQLGTQLSAQSTLIKSDRSEGYHSEISQAGDYSGIVCAPKNTFSQKTSAGRFRFFIQCEFDLSKAKLETAEEKAKKARDQKTGAADSKKRSDALADSAREPEGVKSRAAYEEGLAKVLSIVSVPACDDFMVKGERARVEKCHANPNDFSMRAEDTEVIVRKSGYQSKSIDLKDVREANLSAITVVLDPL